MYLLTDYIFPDSRIAYVDSIAKIGHNLSNMETLKDNIELRRKTNKKSIFSITVLGRWLIFYQEDLIDKAQVRMYFIDFRLDLTSFNIIELLSIDSSVLAQIIQLQTQHDSYFSDALDTIELSMSEPFERVIKENLFTCDNNEIVLRKARELGLEPMIEHLKEGDTVKVVLADETIRLYDESIINLYALIHFGGTDNGFAYLKLYDATKNRNMLKDFEAAVNATGVNVDTGIILERFTKSKLN